MRTTVNTAIITHREFIADVAGSVAFAASEYAVNPGNSAVFPWLAQIALRYESYVFKRLHFEFETVSSTLTAGSIMMACDYDAADNAPVDKQTLMSYAQATRSAPWQECSFAAKSSDLTKFTRERYVRGDTPPSGDIKTYDVANFFLATQGMTNADAVGELYVSYTVELRTPQLNLAAPSLPLEQVVLTGNATNSAFFGTPTTAESTALTYIFPTPNSVLISGATIGARYRYDAFGNGGYATGYPDFSFAGAVPVANSSWNTASAAADRGGSVAEFQALATDITLTCTLLPSTTVLYKFNISRVGVYRP